jgi:predicted peroxiredoxin
MQRIVIFLFGLLLGGGLIASIPPGKTHDDLTGALASPENHPLLLHMTTGDSWRGATGLEFARAMLKIGHPVAVFLNLDAVRLALRTGEQEKKASMPQVPREIIADLIRGGAIVLICQPCLSLNSASSSTMSWRACNSARRAISRISSSPTMCAR